ncbi:MAG: tRNA (N(6)-L-threonylcarbamoyladenosine(37)-C(2))-methylthiotransferase MtaB, partial [Pseudobdellovibrio sp.]
SKRKERAQRLRELSLHRLQSEAMKQIGSLKQALVLNKLNFNNQAVSRDYWNIKLNLSEIEHAELKNTECLVKIVSVHVEELDVVLLAERVKL